MLACHALPQLHDGLGRRSNSRDGQNTRGRRASEVDPPLVLWAANVHDPNSPLPGRFPDLTSETPLCDDSPFGWPTTIRVSPAFARPSSRAEKRTRPVVSRISNLAQLLSHAKRLTRPDGFQACK